MNNFDSVIRLIGRLRSSNSCLMDLFPLFQLHRSCLRSKLFVHKLVLFCPLSWLGFSNLAPLNVESTVDYVIATEYHVTVAFSIVLEVILSLA